MQAGTFEEMLEQRMDCTINGKCSCCGGCCSNILPLSQNEIKAIHKYVKKHNIKEHSKKFPFIEQAVDMTCPFRNDDKKICEIYAIRPYICRIYMCNQMPTMEEGKEAIKEPRIPVNMRKEFFRKGE